MKVLQKKTSRKTPLENNFSYETTVKNNSIGQRLLLTVSILAAFLQFLCQFFFCYNSGELVMVEAGHIVIRLVLYFTLTTLFSLIVFSFKKLQLDNPVDRSNMTFAYIFLLAGTVVFIASEFVEFGLRDKLLAGCLFAIGNLYFYFMHSAFLCRNINKLPEKKWFYYALAACAAVTILYPLVYFKILCFYGKQAYVNNVLIGSCIVYAIIIVTSMFFAYKTWLNKKSGEEFNSLLMILGYSSFAVCEIIVASGIMYNESAQTFITKVVSGLFYTPAFLLLALSGFRISTDTWLKTVVISLLILITGCDIVFIRLMSDKYAEMKLVNWINWIPLIIALMVSLPVILKVLVKLTRHLCNFGIALYSAAGQTLFDLCDAFKPLWFITIVMLIGLVSLFLPQGRDILLSLSDESSNCQKSIFLISTILLALTIWFSTSFTFLITSRKSSHSKEDDPVSRFRRIAPHFLAIFTLIMILAAMGIRQKNMDWIRQWPILSIFSFTILWLYLSLWHEFKSLQFINRHIPDNVKKLVKRIVVNDYTVPVMKIDSRKIGLLKVYMAISVCFNILFLVDPFKISTKIGAASIVFIGCILWISIPCYFHYLAIRLYENIQKDKNTEKDKDDDFISAHRIVTIGTLLLLLTVIIFSSMNNNHSVRTIKHRGHLVKKRITLDEYLKRWVHDSVRTQMTQDRVMYGIIHDMDNDTIMKKLGQDNEMRSTVAAIMEKRLTWNDTLEKTAQRDIRIKAEGDPLFKRLIQDDAFKKTVLDTMKRTKSMEGILKRLHTDRALGRLLKEKAVTKSRRETALTKITQNIEDYKIPLILVASEGGGMRSAYWTASLLSRIHDRDKSHTVGKYLFALSGVSGGCIGNMFFIAGLTANTNTEFSTQVKSALSRDFLAPVVAKLVFPEILQTVVPFPIEAADRATALEQSWEQAWMFRSKGDSIKLSTGSIDSIRKRITVLSSNFKGTTLFEKLIISQADKETAQIGTVEKTAGKKNSGKNDTPSNDSSQETFGKTDSIFIRGFLDAYREERNTEHYSIPSGTDVPLLFCNGTWVETGKRTLVSPVVIKDTAAEDLLSVIGTDIPMSTAGLLSSRFPFISPGGRVKTPNGKTWGHVVDGGYIDNTGALTLLNIYKSIKNSQFRNHVKIITLVIRNTVKEEKEPLTFMNFLQEPVRALFNVQTEFSDIALNLLKNEITQNDDKILEFNMDLDQYDVPLGWYISGNAQSRVDRYISPSRKRKAKIDRMIDSLFYYVTDDTAVFSRN